MRNRSLKTEAVSRRPNTFRFLWCSALFFFGVLLLFSGVMSGKLNADTLQKAFISFRVCPVIWQNDERFNELLALFEKYKGVTDEITFFTQTTHAPIPDDELIRRCELLKERMERARALGYRVGINILCTIGQTPEDLPHSIGPEFQRGVGLTTGKECPATLCPNNDRFRARITRIYTALAQANPDYIWIDDDVRVGHSTGPVCFCDSCMKLFCEFANMEMTREELNARQGEKEIRAKTVDFSSETINNLFVEIEKTVHAVHANLPIGFMTGERYAEGNDFTRWAHTLAGPNHAPVYWRPGGGFYHQDSIAGNWGLFAKSHQIGRQIALLPPEVTLVESEIENFPYERLQKSKQITALEAACHIAAGCTGAAFNVLTTNHEPLSDYEPLVATLFEWRPFYDKMVQTLGRYPTRGVFPLWKQGDGKLVAGNPMIFNISELTEIGIPIAYERGNSSVFLLTREFLDNESKDDVLDYLSQGLYTDTNTVNLLNSPNDFNFVELTGMEFGKAVPVDALEKYTDHPLNGANAGRDRDGRQSFWHDPAFGLHKTDERTEALSSLVDYSGTETAAMSLGIFENRLGGRICINGYQPWNHFFSKPKSEQIKNIMRWLSRDQLPAWIDSFHRAHLWCRLNNDGTEGGFVVVNSTYDPAENLTVMLRTTCNEITVVTRNTPPQNIPTVETEGPYRKFILPTLPPWDVALLVMPPTASSSP